MKRYHFRLYVGPTVVQQIAAKLRDIALPWQQVTIEGTAHVHFSIAAMFEQAAQTEITQWFSRAGLSFALSHGVQLLRAEDVTKEEVSNG